MRLVVVGVVRGRIVTAALVDESHSPTDSDAHDVGIEVASIVGGEHPYFGGVSRVTDRPVVSVAAIIMTIILVMPHVLAIIVVVIVFSGSRIFVSIVRLRSNTPGQSTDDSATSYLEHPSARNYRITRHGVGHFARG